MKYLLIIVALAVIVSSCRKTEKQINTVTKVDSVNVDTGKVKTYFYKGSFRNANGALSPDQITTTSNYLDNTITFVGAGLNNIFSYPDQTVFSYTEPTTNFTTVYSIAKDSLTVRKQGVSYFTGKKQ